MKWGLDFTGSINPPSSSRNNFILTATYYFTRWYEFIPLKNYNDDSLFTFFEETLLPIFGVMVDIVADNGPALISHKFSSFYNKYNIKHSFSSSYYPQGNELVELTNKQLINILKKITNEKPQQWHTLLPYELWPE